ncbi:MAG: hypothetical protein AAF585_24740 [Verrucomicrobiota bacterium]
MARPQLEYVPTDKRRSFIFKIDRDIWPVYHFHPEIDILLVLKNTGEFISGDYIGRMEPGTLFMNGPGAKFHGVGFEPKSHVGQGGEDARAAGVIFSIDATTVS